MTLVLQVKTRSYRVSCYREASEVYEKLRDKSEQGASRFPNGKIFKDKKQVAHISYNGRVWAGATYVEGAEPLYG